MSRWRALWDEPVLAGIPAGDLALAAALVVWTLLAEVQLTGPGHPWVALAAVGWAGAVALRRRVPLAMAVIGAASIAAFSLVPHAPDVEPFAATLVLMFAVGQMLAGWRLALAGGLVAAASVLLEVLVVPDQSVVTRVLSVLLILYVPMVVGQVVRRTRAQSVRLQELARELAAEQDARARDAAAAERNRIARDLHDVIAHSVSVMVVQAGAAEHALDPAAPARPSLQAVRRTGQATMTELRRQLTVLREVP